MHEEAPVLRRVERSAHAGRERADCFGDEVVVDFPSLVAVADRMCESFLAADDDATPFAAEVRITPREARAGRRVPVQVALRCTCVACGGRGEVWSETCERCAGSGGALARHQVHVTLPSGVRDGARFLFSVTQPYASATVVDLRVTIAQ